MDDADHDLLMRQIETCAQSELANTAHFAYLEARIMALEDALGACCASGSIQSTTEASLRHQIHEATVRNVHQILGGYSDMNSALASMVKRHLDQTRFGPFPLPDEEEL